MDFLGTIAANSDPPGVDLSRWAQLIAKHANLEPVTSRVGLNPFTKGPLVYPACQASAWVVVAGNRVGMMSWAQDGTRKIAVWGEASVVDDIAMNVATGVGGVYRQGSG